MPAEKLHRLVWWFALAGLVLWTLLAWGTWALLDGAGALLVAQAEWFGTQPELQYWLQWALRLFEQLGAILIAIVWAVGALLFLAAATLGRRAFAALARHRRLLG